MKRRLAVLCYGLALALGVIWVYGCSTSPTGGNPNPLTYELELLVQPAAVYADTGQATVSCFLRLNDSLVTGEIIRFRATSQAVSNSNILSQSETTDTTATGLWLPVTYNPNDYPGDIDTIFATFLNDVDDTLAIDTALVNVIHP